MPDIIKIIESYGYSVGDIDVSPFETIDMLHRRTRLESLIPQMSNHEKLKLLYYDIHLIEGAKEMYEHLKEIYDFTFSTEPLNLWWWHLDKVSTGELLINYKAEVDVMEKIKVEPLQESDWEKVKGYKKLTRPEKNQLVTVYIWHMRSMGEEMRAKFYGHEKIAEVKRDHDDISINISYREGTCWNYGNKGDWLIR